MTPSHRPPLHHDVRLRACLLWLVSSALGCAAPLHTTPPRPPSAEAYFQRGNSFASQGDSLRAEQYFGMALRAGYPEKRILRPLLAACLRASRLRAARSHAESYLRRHPGAFHVRHVAAGLHLALGNARAARRELHRVLRDRPGLAHAHYLLGVLARDDFADRASAQEHFAAYLELEPGGAHEADARHSLELARERRNTDLTATTPNEATDATPSPGASP